MNPLADKADEAAALNFRAPRPEDGPAVSALIRECPPLDVNSAYCNLLQCLHFADTCVVAERNGKMVGWISAYRPPAEPERIFVWQVAVHEHARGLGLGRRMLDALLDRPASRGATTLITTITEANDASWALFGSFARRHGADIHRRPLFDRDVHFAGAHDTELLVSIGPLGAQSALSVKEAS
ncbi:MAG: diaminobutyrate acetyltransferase [Parvibaculum sp.]|nr:diaminobutyrate acetyltransferase [Parvibaculum sp.]